MTQTQVLDPVVLDVELEETAVAAPSKTTKAQLDATNAAVGGILFLGLLGAAAWLFGGDDAVEDDLSRSEIPDLVSRTCSPKTIADGNYYHQNAPAHEAVIRISHNKLPQQYHILDITHSYRDGSPGLAHEYFSLKIELHEDCDEINVYCWDSKEAQWLHRFGCSIPGQDDFIEEEVIEWVNKMGNAPANYLAEDARRWLVNKIRDAIHSTIGCIASRPENKDKRGAIPVVELISRIPDMELEFRTQFELDSEEWMIEPFTIARVLPDEWELDGNEVFNRDELVDHFMDLYDTPTAQAIVKLLEEELPAPLTVTKRADRTKLVDIDGGQGNQLCWEFNGVMYCIKVKYERTEKDGTNVARLCGLFDNAATLSDHEFDDWIRKDLLETYADIPHLDAYLNEITQFVETEVNQILQIQSDWQ